MINISCRLHSVVTAVCVIISFIAVYLCFSSLQDPIVYFNNVKVFNDFAMTKEMKAIGERSFENKKKEVDSLYRIVQHGSLTGADQELAMQEFLRSKQSLETFNETFASEESAKIWLRIQAYSQDYAILKKYKMILGSENKSAVIYSDQQSDITNDFIQYANKRYEGRN